MTENKTPKLKALVGIQRLIPYPCQTCQSMLPSTNFERPYAAQQSKNPKRRYPQYLT